MPVGLSDRIRSFAKSRYVAPAVRDGRQRFSIRVKDVLTDEGVPVRNTPQVCDALTGRKFLRENNLEIERVDGPPSKQSPTVVVHYRVAGSAQELGGERNSALKNENAPQEDASARATRLTEKLRGILKEEFAEYGGGEAFLRWVRSEDDEAA